MTSSPFFLLRPLTLVLVGTLALGLAGCVGFGAKDTDDADHPVQEIQREPGSAFPKADVENVFRVGLRAIDERYIDPVHLDEVAFAGLKGLETLDSTISVTRKGAELEMARNGQVFDRIPAPIGQDSVSWAIFISNTLASANTAAPDTLGTMDPEQFYKAVFGSALAHLDSFSRYASRYEAKTNRGSRRGFGGVGIVYDVSPTGVVVTRVIPDSPAQNADVRAGDLIVAIDGRPLRGVSKSQIRDWIQGPKGSMVALSFRRPPEAEDRLLTLTRTQIVMPTVDVRLDEGIAIITVSSFNQSTTTAVAEAVGQAFKPGALMPIKGFVLDLRGNPGGLLDQAVALSDLFMESGPIVSTRGRHPDARQFYNATSGDLAVNEPIVVLIDGDSASSAEILAAALQDSGRAVVIGTASYGKGTVQTLVPLPNGGEIFLTWSRYYSPSGYLPDGLGVLPVLCTSGFETSGDAAAILGEARAHPDRATAEAVRWRASLPTDGTARKALRNVCPSEHHAMSAVDETLAKQVLNDSDLYKSLLRPVSPSLRATYSP